MRISGRRRASRRGRASRSSSGARRARRTASGLGRMPWDSRHSGERRNSFFLVVPAEAGTQCLAFSADAKTDSRPCVFSLALPGERVTFSACPEKVTKERAPSVTRPSLREGCAPGSRGFADRPSLPAATAARSLAPPAREVCRARRPGKPRPRGCPFFGYLLLDKRKKVTRRPWMADEKTQGCKPSDATAPKHQSADAPFPQEAGNTPVNSGSLRSQPRSRTARWHISPEPLLCGFPRSARGWSAAGPHGTGCAAAAHGGRIRAERAFVYRRPCEGAVGATGEPPERS
jgi:hypothetical protein